MPVRSPICRSTAASVLGTFALAIRSGPVGRSTLTGDAAVGK